jgi:[ribosomal protein S18]-alanine N-acetyltransferase
VSGSGCGKPTVTLRPARTADIGGLRALEIAVFTTDILSAQSFRRFIASPGATLLVADDAAGKLAGYVLVLYPPRTTLARLYSIAVQGELEGRGLGQELLAEAETAARRHGRTAMRIEVHEQNRRALAFYGKSGYRPLGRRADYYDDGGDALRFEKPLAP